MLGCVRQPARGCRAQGLSLSAEHLLKLARPKGSMRGIVPAQVLAFDEDVGNGPLPRVGHERGLQGSASLNPIEFNSSESHAHLVEKVLG